MLMRLIQKSGVVGMRIIKGKDNMDTTVMFFHKQNIPPEVADARKGEKIGTADQMIRI